MLKRKAKDGPRKSCEPKRKHVGQRSEPREKGRADADIAMMTRTMNVVDGVETIEKEVGQGVRDGTLESMKTTQETGTLTR